LSVYFRNKSSPRPINSPTDPRGRTHGLERLSCMYRSLDRLPDPWRFLPSVFRSRRPKLSLAAEGEGVSMAAEEASTAVSAIEASVAAPLTEGSVAASPTEGSVAASATDGSLAASAAIM